MTPRSEIYGNIAATCSKNYDKNSAKITAPIRHSTGKVVKFVEGVASAVP